MWELNNKHSIKPRFPHQRDQVVRQCSNNENVYYRFEKTQSIVFLLKLILSKASVKQIIKDALALGLGKSIFVQPIFRMNTQLHIQANHNI